MKIKNALDRAFALLAVGIRKITAVILMVMIVSVTLQIISRPLNLHIAWTEEVSTYSLIWMTYLGGIVCVIKGQHLCIDLFLARYTPKQRRAAHVFIDLVITIFCALMFVFGVKLCMSPIIINGRTPALGMSRLYVYLSLPISMGCSLIYIAYDLIVSVIDLFTGGKLITDEEIEEKTTNYEK